jgi:hypothetical protein
MALLHPRTKTCQQTASNKALQHRMLHYFALKPSAC